MARGDNTSVNILLPGLEEFESASGLQVNVMKPSIDTSGIVGLEKEQIQNLTQISMGTLRFIYATCSYKTQDYALYTYYG